MTKIKLSLPSGSEVEKTVLSYFSNGGNYLILDAESVGSMGLPIILVCKVNADRVEKIVDENEWQQVKGYLKNIISGGQTNYLATPESMGADENYFTQLTLPVASFDTLKSSYVVPQSTSVDAPQADAVSEVNTIEEAVGAIVPPATPSAEQPAADNTAVAEAPAAGIVADMQPVNMSTEPAVETPAAPDDKEAIVNPLIGEEPIANESLNATVEEVEANNDMTVAPVSDEIAAPVAEAPVVDTPVVETPVAEAPVVDTPVIETPAAPVVETPAVVEPAVTPVVDTPADDVNPINLDEIKAEFMAACEKMFESLSKLK